MIVVGVSASLLSRFHLPLPLFSDEFSLPPLFDGLADCIDGLCFIHQFLCLVAC